VLNGGGGRGGYCLVLADRGKVTRSKATIFQLSCTFFAQQHRKTEELLGPSAGEGKFGTADDKRRISCTWIVGQPGKAGLSFRLKFFLFCSVFWLGFG